MRTSKELNLLEQSVALVYRNHNFDIDRENLFGSLKKLSHLTVIIKNFADMIIRNNERYLNPSITILRMSDTVLFSKLE